VYSATRIGLDWLRRCQRGGSLHASAGPEALLEPVFAADALGLDPLVLALPLLDTGSAGAREHALTAARRTRGRVAGEARAASVVIAAPGLR
jgi:hypothetical protein